MARPFLTAIARCAFVLFPTSVLALPMVPATALPATPKGWVEPGSGPCSAILGCQVVRPGFFDCDNSSITEALTRSPLVEIRVVAGSSAENVLVEDRSLALVGGYATCADARNGVISPLGPDTTIDSGGSGLPTLHIRNTTAVERLVVLRRLDITGTNGAAQGGLRIDGTRNGGQTTLSVSARSVRIHDNFASNGGGVHVRTARLFLLPDTLIEENSASQRGGGVHCQDAEVEFLGSAALIGNQALLDGGGLYADDCSILFSPGVISLDETTPSGIHANVSQLGSGGGMHVGGGSTVYLGNETYGALDTAVMSDNRANAADSGLGSLGGGAIYATGTGTEVVIANATFYRNRAGSDFPVTGATASIGGAIAVADNASVRLERNGACKPATADGSYSGLCTVFAHNRATGAGAAIHVVNATLWASGLNLQDNDGGAGGMLHFAGSGLKTVDTALLAHGDSFDATRTLRNAIRVDSGAAVLRSLTLADNLYTESGIGAGIGSVDVRAVLVDDMRWPAPPGMAWDDSAPPAAACVALPTGSTLPPGAVMSLIGVDAGFTAQQRLEREYRLPAESALIDACSTAHYAAFNPAEPDSDRQSRGRDDPAVLGVGTVDIGMDESVPDAIFGDGFEASLLVPIPIPVPIPGP